MPDGRIMHSEIKIGDALVYVNDHFSEFGGSHIPPTQLKGHSATIHLVADSPDDVDAICDRAVKAGATAKMPPADQFWGDRYGSVEDPFGHGWSISAPISGVCMPVHLCTQPSNAAMQTIAKQSLKRLGMRSSQQWAPAVPTTPTATSRRQRAARKAAAAAVPSQRPVLRQQQMVTMIMVPAMTSSAQRPLVSRSALANKRQRQRTRVNTIKCNEIQSTSTTLPSCGLSVTNCLM
jgi:uncharacterized glyoxalase superfamily protein PhnB